MNSEEAAAKARRRVKKEMVEKEKMGRAPGAMAKGRRFLI